MARNPEKRPLESGDELAYDILEFEAFEESLNQVELFKKKPEDSYDVYMYKLKSIMNHYHNKYNMARLG